ncbi:hypothetical protein [Streptomyces rubiginosohelvolus]|uniref:hypothetical protein n=1 Tax=Streptomyces rubiginosohelvolus TaxID=67362 RepID=UPI0033B7EA55
MIRVSSAAKAFVAGIAAGAGVAATAVQDGIFTTGETVTTVLAILGALGVTYVVPNRQQGTGA